MNIAESESLQLPFRNTAVLDAQRTATLRRLVRRCAGLPERGAGLNCPGPVDAFIITHPCVQALVTDHFPGHTSLVHVSQDIELRQELSVDTAYTSSSYITMARAAVGGADVMVTCTLDTAEHAEVAAVLRAQIRLGGVSPEEISAVEINQDTPAVARIHPVREGMQQTGSLRFTHADVVEYARCSGDDNPIHLDDKAGRAAGFEGAIVHGMAVVAASFETVLNAFADNDIRRVSRLAARFSAATPVDAVSRCEITGSPGQGAVSFKVTGPLGTSVKNGHVMLAVGS